MGEGDFLKEVTLKLPQELFNTGNIYNENYPLTLHQRIFYCILRDYMKLKSK